MSNTLWSGPGRDESYEMYRINEIYVNLRKWVDEAYYEKGLHNFLDPDYKHKFQNTDFFAHLWELELAEWFYLAGLSMIPTRGKGPDFCLELSDGRKIWIEAVLATAGNGLEQLWRNNISTDINDMKVYNTPVDEITLRYANSLYTKAIKIQKSYLKLFGPDDMVLIAVSGFPGGALDPSIEFFIRAVTTADSPVVHFSTDGTPLDPEIRRATHAARLELTKPNGSPVPKQFLYPGNQFPYIDGALFSEASNLQGLLGRHSLIAEDDPESTNIPHIIPNYSSEKQLPGEFTDSFYLHKFVDNPPFISLESISPKKKVM